MGTLRALELLKKYADCPDCGSDKVGNGAGTLEIEDNTFTRTCKCGFEITIKD
jgi:hypothetical protein